MARFRLGMKHCLILFDPELFGEVMAHEDYYPERFPVPIIETYAKRRNRAMFNIQYVKKAFSTLKINRKFFANLTANNYDEYALYSLFL